MIGEGTYRRAKNRLPWMVKISAVFIGTLFLIAFLAPVISNNKPVYLSYKGYHFFPALSGKAFGDIRLYQNEATERINFAETDWKNLPGATVLMPLIPWAPHQSDLVNSGYKSPFETHYQITGDGRETPLNSLDRHLLGTGKRGEDLLAGLIYGTRISLTVGLFSMIIAGIIGVFLGALAGYFGDEKIKTSRSAMLFTIIGIIPSWFYAFSVRSIILESALEESMAVFLVQLFISMIIFLFVLILFALTGKLISYSGILRKQIFVPVDALVSRLIEILISLPRLMLIIAIAAVSKPSLINLVLIIGFTSWTEIARFTRAEMYRLRNVSYIQSARSMGFREFRIIFRHALPNALAPSLVAIAFGIASAILVESGLSFLGIGVPQDVVTWGSLLASGKENFSAWWLVVFPGLAIFATVTAYNLIGEGLRDWMDPKG